MVRGRVEDQVVRDVAVDFAQCDQRIAHGNTDSAQRGVVAVGEVQVVAARDDQQLVRGAGPVGADAHHVVGGEEHALAIDQLGLDCGAQNAATFETGEGTLLFENLAGYEGQAQQLTVRVGERCASFATVVDDGLRVANMLGGGVLLQAPLQHPHHVGGVFVGDELQPAVMVGREHEDLVNATGLCFHVHRAVVVNRKRLVAFERRVQVGDDTHAPVAAGVERLERRQRRLFVAGAEWAGATRL